MVEAAVGAIIGGSIAGGAVLLAILIFVIYLLCGKRRRRHQRENKKFQQLSPHTSPAHSQPSTLGHGGPGDPRLPKVSSNGLWVGTPSIYAATPSPAYYIGRPLPKHGHPVQPVVMQRPISETRIPHQVPGPLYATGSNQRIYHSQQLTPVYEVMDPRTGNIYDVYEVNGGAGSKTRLIHDGKGPNDRRDKSHHNHHGHYAHHDPSNKRLERSQSDRAVAGEPARRPHHNSKQGANGKRSSNATSIASETVLVHESSKKPSQHKSAYENHAFSTDKMQEVEKVTSSTDSMKILAKNKTDDQKTVVHATSSSSSVPATANFRDGKLIPVHYMHEGGDIYAVPHKNEDMRRSSADNPILARMQDMVIERTEEMHVARNVDPFTDITETAEPLIITPSGGSSHSSRGTSIIQNPIYQEVEEVQLRDPSSDVVMSAHIRARNTAAASAAQSTGDYAPASGESYFSANGPVVKAAASASEASSSGANVVASTSAGVDSVDHGDGMDYSKEMLGGRWSTDTDGTADDLSNTGKHITTAAFEFLDKYLSDEEGGDMHSQPQSPVLSDQDDDY